MKKLLMITLIAIFATPGAWAQTKSKKRSSQAASQSTKNIDMSQQFDTLGSNQDIIEKAKALQPTNSMRIVQKREVDRNWRGELGLNYGLVSGGDTYMETRAWGAVAELHITPNWSLGVRYTDHKSDFTSEGKRVYDEALAKIANGATNVRVPDVDYQENSLMATVSWYPIYGKISWLQSVVSQFDFYLLAGGGQTKLSQTTSPIYTGGAGMGIWWNNRVSSRLEVRYENYKDTVYTGERNVSGFVAQFGIGFML